MDAKSKSYHNDVVIEFKINCNNPDLILHDIKKLEKIKKLDKYIAPLFINVFSNEINFRNYLLKTQKLFENTKVYCITICPKISGFYVKEGLQIIENKLNEITFIVNNARFIETRLIPNKFDVIRVPNERTKNILLYPAGRKYAGIGSKIKVRYSSRKYRISRGWLQTEYITYCEPK